MPGRFPPDLFGLELPTVASKLYQAIYVGPDTGSERLMQIWRYANGEFQSEVKADLAVADANDSELSSSIQVIVSDPAGKVAAGSVLFRDSTVYYVYDPDADTIYSHGTFGISSDPLWNPADGWIYYLDNLSDSGDLRLRKIRADMTGDIQVSSSSFNANFENGLFWLTPASFYALGTNNASPFEDDLIGEWPLDGSAPSSVILGAESPIPGNPRRHGIPTGTDSAIYLKTSSTLETIGDEVRAWRFDGPSTETPLWDELWAQWQDPNGSSRVLSHSLNPAGDELAVYSVRGYGTGDYGIIRAGIGVQGPTAPVVVPVSQHGGVYPDYMFAMD